MVYHSLIIRARFCPEIVERILRVIRHRGFELYSLNMLLSDELHRKQVTLFVTVFSGRNIHLLYSQLSKLMDVHYIEMR